MAESYCNTVSVLVAMKEIAHTHVLLLFVYVTYLEPDVLLGQRPWRVVDDILEALQKLSARCHYNHVVHMEQLSYF